MYIIDPIIMIGFNFHKKTDSFLLIKTNGCLININVIKNIEICEKLLKVPMSNQI